MSQVDGAERPRNGTPCGVTQRELPRFLYILTAAAGALWLLARLIGR